MDVQNHLTTCRHPAFPFTRRRLSDVTTVIVHRCAIDHVPGYDNSPVSMARFFREHPDGRKATGGKFPYHLLVQPDGTIQQCVSLLDRAPGAGAVLNRCGLQVAFIGDFRKVAPTKAQLDAGVNLLAHFSLYAPTIIGHTDRKDLKVSLDDGKVCPGKLFQLEEFTKQVRLKADFLAVRVAGEFGLIL